MIRIMILDDDEMYLKKEKEITEHYFAEKNIDCTVTTYQNVEWFLLGLKEEKFDMYLLDIRMPGENGIEAAREIRRLYPNPVIIFITNFVADGKPFKQRCVPVFVSATAGAGCLLFSSSCSLFTY